MNRLALIAATGFLTLALTACGGHDNKQPVSTTDTTTTTTQPAPQPAGGDNQNQNH